MIKSRSGPNAVSSSSKFTYLRKAAGGAVIGSMLVFGSVSAFAVDRQTTISLADISKYETQFSSQPPSSASSAKRTLKLVKLIRGRLDGVADKTDPTWLDADKRLKTLVAYLNGIISPSAATTPAPATQAATPPPAATTPAPATQAATPPPAAPKQNAASAPQKMISQQRTRVKKLGRDIISATQTLDKNGPKPFQSQDYVAKWQASVQRFKTRLGKFTAFQADPDVVATTQALTTLEDMMAFGYKIVAANAAELGDVQARLKSYHQAIRNLKIPETALASTEKGQYRTWLIALAKTRKAAVAILQALPEIQNKAYLPLTRRTVSQGGAYDQQDVGSMISGLQREISNIDQTLKNFTSNTESVISHVPSQIALVNAYDPTDRMVRINSFLGEGEAEEQREYYAKTLIIVSEVADFDKLMKRASYDDRIKLLKDVEASRDLYEANHKKALSLVRLSSGNVENDEDLVEIAAETMAEYDYIGSIERIVLNSEKTHREKDTSDIEFDKVDVKPGGSITLSGTETSYHYEWDQYQVASAEPVGDKFYVFYTTLKFYTSGSETTTLDKWIVSNRLQGSEIPEENIELD